MKKLTFKITIIFSLIIFNSSLHSEDKFNIGETKFGLEVGIAYIPTFKNDLKTTSDSLANSLNSNVTHATDISTTMLRGYAHYELGNDISFESGIFLSDKINTKFSYSGGSKTISQDIKGVDLILHHTYEEEFDLRAGLSYSVIDGNSSVLLGSQTSRVVNNDDGVGFVLGVQVDDNYFTNNNKLKYSITHYGGLGGSDDAGATILNLNYQF